MLGYLIINWSLEFKIILKLMGKIIKLFLNMYCDVHYYSAEFEIKIQLVYGDTEKTNCI